MSSRARMHWAPSQRAARDSTISSGSTSSSSTPAPSELEIVARQLMDKRLAEKTKKDYRSSEETFLRYYAHASTKEKYPELYDASGRFDLARYTTEHFVLYISARTRGRLPQEPPSRAGQKPVRRSSLGHDKSALLEMYREQGLSAPSDLHARVKVLFQGASRVETEMRQSGALPAEVGMREMEFSCYRWMCERMLKLGDAFGWAFATLTWNSMNRARNTEETCFSHLNWVEDALVLCVPHSKTNQAGKRKPVPKHIYANHEDPCISSVRSCCSSLLFCSSLFFFFRPCSSSSFATAATALLVSVPLRPPPG
jgi:hypothetical protein